MTDIMVPTSPGDLLDKLTILQLKEERIDDPVKLAHVRHERAALQKIADACLPDDAALAELRADLYDINADLWGIEEDLRAFEGRRDFGPGFIAMARAVYMTNDERAALKRRINLLLDSALVEEKSYRSQESHTL